MSARALLHEVEVFRRENGLLAAAGFAFRRLFGRTRLLHFELDTSGSLIPAPANIRVVTVMEADFDHLRDDMLSVGIGTDISNFQRDTVCYLSYFDDQPAGVGWLFKQSRLLARMGYPASAAYVGGFHVRDFARGHGVYPAMLNHIRRTTADEYSMLVAQTTEVNVPSQRGLYKAGFRCIGLATTIVAGGFIVYCRVRPQSLGVSQPAVASTVPPPRSPFDLPARAGSVSTEVGRTDMPSSVG